MKLTVIALQRPSGPFQIEETENWSVTHVPTGLRVPREFTEEEAINAAYRLGNEVRTPTKLGAVRAGDLVLQISDEVRS